MSLTETTLTDFHQPQTQDVETEDTRVTEAREQALEGGARYRSPPTTTRDEAGERLDTGVRECQNCGRTVPPNYHRGQADADGILWHCGGPEGCVSHTAMKNGAGAKPDYTERCPDTGGSE